MCMKIINLTFKQKIHSCVYHPTAPWVEPGLRASWSVGGWSTVLASEIAVAPFSMGQLGLGPRGREASGLLGDSEFNQSWEAVS